ncbi:hypothetical protein GCM10020001_087740 [Nonomuraea salmonea]
MELGLLIDLLELAGLDGFAQVDLGSREHAPQCTEALGRMSSQIMLAAWSRLERQGRITAAAAPSLRLSQFRRGGRRGTRCSSATSASANAHP